MLLLLYLTVTSVHIFGQSVCLVYFSTSLFCCHFENAKWALQQMRQEVQQLKDAHAQQLQSCVLRMHGAVATI